MFGLKILNKHESIDLEKIEQIQKFIQTEITSINEFESKIQKELREIDDLKYNFNIIKGQIESIRKLSINREKVIENIISENNKKKTDINLEKCKEYFQIITHIDNELTPMISKVYAELQKLFVDETHILYKESEDNRRAMHKIDDVVRKMAAEVHMINKRIEAYNSELQKISNELRHLEQERLRRPDKPAGRIGFQ